MQLSVEIPDMLWARFKTVADTIGETPERFVILALAERIARLEHIAWLRQHPAKEGSGLDSSVLKNR